MMAELSYFSRDLLDHKASNIYYLALFKKKFVKPCKFKNFDIMDKIVGKYQLPNCLRGNIISVCYKNINKIQLEAKKCAKEN